MLSFVKVALIITILLEWLLPGTRGTATEPQELPPNAVGGEEISTRATAAVLNGTMSYGECVPCDAFGFSPQKPENAARSR